MRVVAETRCALGDWQGGEVGRCGGADVEDGGGGDAGLGVGVYAGGGWGCGHGHGRDGRHIADLVCVCGGNRLNGLFEGYFSGKR